MMELILGLFDYRIGKYRNLFNSCSLKRMKLNESFYERPDVVRIARELLGKGLFTNIDGVITGGLIVETEAYSFKERGCHAYASRKTDRNAIMFESGGYSYVYLCYGMHHLFNVVTNVKGVAEAVLIRALEPTHGLAEMTLRRGKLANPFHLTSGPGKLTKALGIDRNFNAKSLSGDEIWIEDVNQKVTASRIEASPRIGIDYAGQDALLPWRFTIRDNKWVSRQIIRQEN
jgi:DNA-3-methyladenine glycosylase